MANTVDDAIKEIQLQMRDISGIRKAPDYITDKIQPFPFVFAYPGSGLIRSGPPELMTGLHNINLELHVAHRNLERNAKASYPYADSIPKQILGALKSGDFSTIKTFGDITYEFGPLSWAGIETLGFVFTVQDVKIQAATST